LSILGKLYLNYLLTPDYTDSLFLISNASYKFKLNDGRDSTSLKKIACRQLLHSEVQKVRHKLSMECGDVFLFPIEPALYFEVTSLSLHDHSAHTKGKVEEFLEAILPAKKHAVTPAYRVLSDWVRRKTIFEEEISSFEELKLKTGISRNIMDEILDTMGATLNPSTIWEETRERLVHEGVSARDVRRIALSWEQYEIERMDPTNEPLQGLRKNLTLLCKDMLSREPDITLKDIMDSAYKLAEKHGLQRYYNQEYIYVVALMEFYTIAQLS
jgi:hypothetical protein